MADRADEGGFTLIEMLVVIVILPLVIGAAAAIIISSEQNSRSVQGRLSDSADAQLTAANFVRDVQGASMLTTDSSAASPTVCGTGGAKFLLGLYHPADTATHAQVLDVGYWELQVTAPSGTTYEAVRYSCTLTGSTSVVSSSTIVSQSINSANQQVADITTPNSSYGDPALGWIPSAAVTTVPTATNLSGAGDAIPLTSTQGFQIGTSSSPQKLYFMGDVGSGSFVLETVSCTGGAAGTPGKFTGCSGGSGTIDAATLISQPASITSVHLTLTEVASSYIFGLRSTPRVFTAFTGGNVLGVPGTSPSGGGAGTGSTGNGSGSGGCCNTGNGGPALLTLGPGVSIQGASNSSLTVNGIVSINAGTITCTGSPTMTADEYLTETGTSAIGSCAQGTVASITSPTPDPFAGTAPIYPTQFPAAGSSSQYGSATNSGGKCTSGLWTVQLPSGCNLEPGLYVLKAGYCSTGSSLSMASDATPGEGVLLYVPPGAAPCGSSTTADCSGTRVPYSFQMGGNSSLGVPPLNADQANTIFGSTGMAGVVIWQDAGNAYNLQLGGTAAGIDLGVSYAPSSLITLQGNGSGNFGQIIASCVSIAGSTPLTVTG